MCFDLFRDEKKMHRMMKMLERKKLACVSDFCFSVWFPHHFIFVPLSIPLPIERKKASFLSEKKDKVTATKKKSSAWKLKLLEIALGINSTRKIYFSIISMQRFRCEYCFFSVSCLCAIHVFSCRRH